jgi:hypothetical protein
MFQLGDLCDWELLTTAQLLERFRLVFKRDMTAVERRAFMIYDGVPEPPTNS